MGVFKFFIKNGFGSIGETIKVLSRSYNIISTNESINIDKFSLFKAVFNQRKFINQNVSEQGDRIKNLEFEHFENKIVLLHLSVTWSIETQISPTNDLAVFLFCIRLFESGKFRLALKNLSEKRRTEVFEIIYETVLENAPKGLSSQKDTFCIYAEHFFYCFLDSERDLFIKF